MIAMYSRQILAISRFEFNHPLHLLQLLKALVLNHQHLTCTDIGSYKLCCTAMDHIPVAGNQVELVHGFCYLCSPVEAEGGNGPEVRRHEAIACGRMSSLQHRIWKSGIRTDTKFCLFKVYILPVLLNGAKTWTLTRTLETKLDVFQHLCLRRILLF